MGVGVEVPLARMPMISCRSRDYCLFIEIKLPLCRLLICRSLLRCNVAIKLLKAFFHEVLDTGARIIGIVFLQFFLLGSVCIRMMHNRYGR
ncbi:hypothetical protein D8B22_11420 [Verminephrobacter aporrectodeae subsp. tuberculatae]|nr:hypothetical protein [Verminephrobacter aporrectodeae subsp. tuberculatae]MCW8169701.1 hypothetical protein [Verminephrobacter aporrectodeae subsp. tuberculatae]